MGGLCEWVTNNEHKCIKDVHVRTHSHTML